MPRHHTTVDGNVPFTPEEETARDAEEAAWTAEQAANAWLVGRTGSVTDGGYGSSSEQFEILGEQGTGAYQSHITAVKKRFPKPA